MINRVFLGVGLLVLGVGVTGCNSAYKAKEGDCIDKGGMMVDLNDVSVVDCDSPDAKYKVSAVLEANRKDDCPKDGMFTFSWQANDKTICIKSVK